MRGRWKSAVVAWSLFGLMIASGCGKGGESEPASSKVAPAPQEPAPEPALEEPEFVIEAQAAIVEVAEVPDAGIELGLIQIEEASPAKPRKAKSRRRKARPRGDQVAASVAAPAAKPRPQRLGQRTVLRTIRAHMGDVERCYNASAGGSDAGGRVVLQWTLGSNGQPTGVAVLKDTLPKKSVSKCLKTAAKGWRFPPPEGGVAVVTYPFNFAVQ
ncbi:MAG: AgmX/PglI C-terminal domain-containing protein [Bradymonadia bacterium]